jgi:hypothetical protein
MADMPARDLRMYAKEMLMEGIDEKLRSLFGDPVNGITELGEQWHLVRERNRVARFLSSKLPEACLAYFWRKSDG